MSRSARRRHVCRTWASSLVAVVMTGVVGLPAYAEPTRTPQPSASATSRTTAPDSELQLILDQLTRLLRRLAGGQPQVSTAPAAGKGTKASESPRPRQTNAVKSPTRGQATRSGLPWPSGAWVGGRFTPAGIDAFGEMRGRKADLVTTYGYTESPAKMSGDEWPITTWQGFDGKLNYGLPLAFKDGTGLDAVASGAADQNYRAVARSLVKHGRGDSVMRAGWEFNYKEWPWGTSTKNVDSFKKAFRRAATVMRAEAPELRFEFGINCNDGLSGSSDRLAPLKMGYPGDDVVDIVGCDTYDRWSAHAADAAGWKNVLHGEQGPGIQDVVDFARQHGKSAGFGEWGLAKPDGKNNAGGDNPFYISSMYRFFAQNADAIAFECYFDENDAEMANSLVLNQMPRSRQAYASLWGGGTK